MLMIRLQRVGRKNDPAYRVVVCEKRSKPHTDGVELLGSYHPKIKQLALKEERILYWLSKGAQTSPTVRHLFARRGIMRGMKMPMGAAGGKSEGSKTVEAIA